MSFEAAKASLDVALDSNLTVGAEIDWDPQALMHPSDPPLGVVYADIIGRLWRSTHHEGKNTLVCVLDTRGSLLGSAGWLKG